MSWGAVQPGLSLWIRSELPCFLFQRLSSVLTHKAESVEIVLVCPSWRIGMDCSLQGCAYAQVSILYLEFTVAFQAEGFLFFYVLYCSDIILTRHLLWFLQAARNTHVHTRYCWGSSGIAGALWVPWGPLAGGGFMGLGSFLCAAGFCSIWPGFPRWQADVRSEPCSDVFRTRHCIRAEWLQLIRLRARSWRCSGDALLLAWTVFCKGADLRAC